eukprot:TRINITY_DN64190_c0_g1_i1.p1 TRINITY_DN64190_c0_g1~~TRINITY_DN64190_c0_g1_i1.p1  ORF type:complete len:243 (+),score=35.79 TRINITY_DN64190_c0_g1_i1:44-772(+)
MVAGSGKSSQTLAANIARFNAVSNKTCVVVSNLDKRVVEHSREAGDGQGAKLVWAPARRRRSSKQESHSDTASSPSEAGLHSSWTLDFLLGDWVDEDHCTVCVHWNPDAPTSAVATIHREARDLVLDVWEAPDGSGWRCGDAVLDATNSSGLEIIWHFPDKRVARWWRMPYMAMPYPAPCPGIFDAENETEEEAAQRKSMWGIPRTQAIDVNHLAWWLSGGATTTMLMPIVDEEGRMTLTQF